MQMCWAWTPSHPHILSQSRRRASEAPLSCNKSTGLPAVLPSHQLFASHVQAFGISWSHGTNKEVAQSKHKLPCADPLHNASVCSWLPSWQGDQRWERQELFTLDVSPEESPWGCQHRASSGLPAPLFYQQGSCPASTTGDMYQTNWLQQQSLELPSLRSRTRTGYMETRLLLGREELSLDGWEGIQKGLSLADLTWCSRQKYYTGSQSLRNLLLPPLIGDAGQSPLPAAISAACPDQCCLSPFCTLPLEAADSGATLTWKNQVAISALLQTVSPRDDHTWSPSCCCSCPSVTLAPCLLL